MTLRSLWARQRCTGCWAPNTALTAARYALEPSIKNKRF
jgi:hypothetical protein